VSILQTIEDETGCPREQWTREQWQQVAERLARIVDGKPRKRRGRPPLSGHQKDNIPALSFWAEQEVEEAARKGKRITIKESVHRVMKAAAIRENLNQGRVRQKLDSAVRQVRTFRAAQKSGIK
jgi:hypothetical protein